MPDPADALPDLPLRDGRGRRTCFVVLCLIGLVVGALSIRVAQDRDGLSNTDEAAYAEQAQAILDGRPLELGFVRHFHVKQPADITHPEDFYPPGNGALLALSWAAFGRSDFASTLPSIFLMCLALPLLIYALARQLGASPPFALATGIVVMLSPVLRDHVYQGLADLPLVTMVTAAVVLALSGGISTAAAAGIALGAAFWCKPAAILFGPGIALALWFSERQTWKRSTIRAAAFGLAALITASPWLIRNYDHFGDPLYSGNKHLTAAANDPDYRVTDERKVFWDEELPSFDNFGVAPIVKRFATHVWQIVVDHGDAAFGLWFVLAAVAMVRHRRTFAVVLVIGSYCAALSAIFAIYLRYLMPLIPLATAVSFAFADRVVSQLAADREAGVLRWPFSGNWLATRTRTALIIAGIAVMPTALHLGRQAAFGAREFRPEVNVDSLRDAGRWARENLPDDARVMVQEALRFRYESGLLTVNTPCDRPERMHEVVEYYGVTHIVQLPDGDFAEWSNAHLGPYLKAYASTWVRSEPEGQAFALWTRTLD